MNISNTSNLRLARLLRSGLISAGVVIGAGLVTILLTALWLAPPARELGEFFLYLMISGGISVALGVCWLAYGTQNVPLRAQLIFTYLVAVIISLVNILVTASLMFLSAHDFSLLTLLLVFSSAVSVFFAFIISRQLTRQVGQLVEGANSLAAGDLDTRVKGGGSRELIQLSAAFNQMAERLQQSFERERNMEHARKELVAAIGHDLRTPLASLGLMTEAICDGVTDEAQTKLFLGRMYNEVRYMSGLIDDLFELSQLDAGALKLNPETGNLSDLLSDTLESMRPQAEAKHQTLTGKIEGELPDQRFDMRKTQRILNNLVINAIKYTRESGEIVLTARHEGDSVKVSVTDNGEGISPQDQARIFEPFYRGERSRKRESGGSGLGLAIARRLAEVQGGSISLTSREGQGSTFVFSLPVGS